MFESLIGNQKIKQQLEKIITPSSYPTSLIFHGTVGIGKKIAAIEVCKILNKNNSKIDQGTFLDLHYFGPQFDNTKVFSINSVREIIQTSHLRPIEGEVKVFILDEVEKLSPGGGEALLKILEEPPPKNIYILITSHLDKIIPTIRSRSLEFHFKNLTQNEIKEFLEIKKYEQADLISRLANGSIGNAVRISKDNLLNLRSEIFEKFLNLDKIGIEEVIKPNKYNFPEEYEEKTKFLYLAFFLKSFYCDLLQESPIFNIDLTYPKLDRKIILKSIKLLHDFELKLTENLNHKLHFTTCLFELTQLRR